jgi:hypothetical protein
MKLFSILCLGFVMVIHAKTAAQQVPEIQVDNLKQDSLIEPITTKQNNKKRNWYLDISGSELATRWGRADFDLNGNLDYKMRDIDYDDGAFQGFQVSVGIRKEIAKHLDLGIKGSFFSTHQFVSLYNPNHRLDWEQEGFVSFGYLGNISYHQRIDIGVPLQYRFIDRFFVEAMPSISFNVSHWEKPQNFSTNSQARERYKYVLDNTMNTSKTILFGYGALGYEFKGVFAKLFYQRNLTAVSSYIPLRGQTFTIDFPKWVNWGFTLGVGLNLTEKPILGYDRKRKRNYQ